MTDDVIKPEDEPTEDVPTTEDDDGETDAAAEPEAEGEPALPAG